MLANRSASMPWLASHPGEDVKLEKTGTSGAGCGIFLRDAVSSNSTSTHWALPDAASLQHAAHAGSGPKSRILETFRKQANTRRGDGSSRRRNRPSDAKRPIPL